MADAVARGALKGARGNSGVILSQILRGFARALSGHAEIDCALLAAMMREGANTAYKAVMKPKEGTILTVARVIADEVEKVAGSVRGRRRAVQDRCSSPATPSCAARRSCCRCSSRPASSTAAAWA